MLEKLKTELKSVEEGIRYMELTDTAWSTDYTMLCRKKRTLKRAIKRLEKNGGTL
jgi:hypothetical protein